MDEWLQDLLAGAGPWLLPIIGAGSLIEYVFPPFPGDVVTVVGTYLALKDGASMTAVYLALGVGAVLGPAIDYGIGLWIAPHLRGTAHPRLRRWLTSPAARRTEALFRQWGGWLILGNRFIPGGRSLIFVLAGVTRVSFCLTMSLGILAGLLWNALIVFGTYELGVNADTLLRLLGRVNRAALFVLLGVALIALGIVFVRRLRKRRAG